MKRPLVAICSLSVACTAMQSGDPSPGVEAASEEAGEAYIDFLGTFSLEEGVRLRRTGSGGIDRELTAVDDRLSIRFEDSGVRVDLSEFPGEEITLCFGDLEVPLKIVLPDGTYLFYHGDSFKVDGETYQLEPGSGMSSFSRIGLLLNP